MRFHIDRGNVGTVAEYLNVNKQPHIPFGKDSGQAPSRIYHPPIETNYNAFNDPVKQNESLVVENYENAKA